MPGRYPRVSLAFYPAATDDWLATLSTEFPDAAFEVLASHPTDDGLLGVLEIRAPDANAIVERFEDDPRGCTLTELGDVFDVNKSAASGILRRAERQIVQEFVGQSIR